MDNPTATMGVRDARAELGKLVDRAHYAGDVYVLTKSDEPRAVLLPYARWLELQKLLGVSPREA